MDIRVTTQAFDPQAEDAAFCAGRRDIGSAVSFIGLCRQTNAGQKVNELFLDHYPVFSQAQIARIADAVAARCDCPDIKVLHRVGRILPGEAIVLVVALSAHRENAFEAVRLIMDYLKTDAPLWKRESGPDGERWVEPRPEDVARRAQAEGTPACAI